MITVVGMGCKKGDLTLNGLKALQNADAVVVKSRRSFAAEEVLSVRSDVVFCDDEINSANDFDELNRSIIGKLQSFGDKNIAFCVIGDGASDSVASILDGAAVVHGVGLHSEAVGRNMLSGTVVYSAQELVSVRRVMPVPTVVTQIFDTLLASEVQLKLLETFDYDNELIFSDGKSVTTLRLNELCKQHCEGNAAVYILPKELITRHTFEYYDCVEILSVLRGVNGCPWDRAQTHKSIVKNVIEEAYELANALQNEDIPNIVEELGDLLMQVLFHLEIGEENGEFSPIDVYTALCRKLIDRHPHVFKNTPASNADESLDVWNAQKLKEHKIKNLTENLYDVPRNMSALMRSQKIQSRASKGGYDFQVIEQAIEKVNEEIAEFLNADGDVRLMEGGDLLFAVVNLLRLKGVDCETALLVSADKFVKRVAECERILAEQGRLLKNLSGDEFDAIWAEAKVNVG